MPRMIFWDNDGVLVDTEPLFYRASADVLAEQGVVLTEPIFRDLSLTQGRSALDLLGDAADAATRARLRDERNARFARLLREGGHRIAGVADVLGQLAPRHRMAVVTSSHPEHFDAAHTDTHIRHLFEFVIALHDSARSKPHPDPYLAALKRARVGPEEAVAVEDSPRGVQSAIAARIPCLAVPRGLTRDGDFSGAALVLRDVTEVPAALARIAARPDLRR